MYDSLIRPEYAHTYALFNYTTGEVYTSSCNCSTYALRTLLHRMDGQAREAARLGLSYHLRLMNLRTRTVVCESK